MAVDRSIGDFDNASAKSVLLGVILSDAVPSVVSLKLNSSSLLFGSVECHSRVDGSPHGNDCESMFFGVIGQGMLLCNSGFIGLRLHAPITIPKLSRTRIPIA